MFKIIKNFNWIILSSFLCIFMGIVTFLTFINEGFIPLTDKNLQNLLIVDIFLLLLFFTLIFRNFYRFYYTGKKNKKSSQTKITQTLTKFYKNSSFTKVLEKDRLISTNDVINTNNCHISVCKTKYKKATIG